MINSTVPHLREDLMLYIYLLLGALVLLSYSSPTDRLAGQPTTSSGDVLVALITWFIVLPVWPLAAGWRACTALYDWYVTTSRPNESEPAW